MDYQVRNSRTQQGKYKVDYVLQISGLIQTIMARPTEMRFFIIYFNAVVKIKCKKINANAMEMFVQYQSIT